MESYSSEENLKQKLEELQKQLGKKLKFEESVRSIHFLLRENYLSASPSLRKLFYVVVCRVATILKTRYTAPGFWLAGMNLFEEAERFVTESSEKRQLKSCIAQAKEQLHQADNPAPADPQSTANRGYLFEGHLTVDPEPAQPQWLVQQNLMNAISSVVSGESSLGADGVAAENTNDIMQQLLNSLDSVIPEIFDLGGGGAPRAPPASKDAVAKLPIITVTPEILQKLGPDTECCICKDNLATGDKMQELPCKHTFHPPCLKPWLDEHNSCPICRHELPTDDHKYENWKEREKEAEEERRGAANAVRGGEYMYV